MTKTPRSILDTVGVGTKGYYLEHSAAVRRVAAVAAVVQLREDDVSLVVDDELVAGGVLELLDARAVPVVLAGRSVDAVLLVRPVVVVDAGRVAARDSDRRGLGEVLL